MSKRFLTMNRTTILLGGLVASLFLVPGRSLGPLPVITLTWLLACVAAEGLWHPALDRLTILTMAPAAHLAALAALPPWAGLAVVPLSSLAGALLWRRWGGRAAGAYALSTLPPAAAALELLEVSGVHAAAADGSALSLVHHPGRILWLLGAGALYLAVSQGIRALAAGRVRGTGPGRAWLDAFGYETELVTSGALLTVGLLALFCFEILGYRGILLCVMPVLFVRDGSRRYIELEAAQSKLIQNERLAAKGEMAAEIGHELNNYLAAVSGRAQLLERHLAGGSDEALRGEAERIHQLAGQMAGLAKGLMDFSHREVRRASFGVNELVEKTVEFVRPQTRFRDVAFAFTPDPEVPPVEMDPGQIQQVLLTLFGRAAGSPPAPGPSRNLDIRTFVDDRRRTVGIEIHRGAGPETAPPARNGAADSSREAELGVVQRILARHQGRFESEEGAGAGDTYRVFLPAA